MNVKDALLKKTKALPNGANTIYSDGIQLHTGAGNTKFLAPCEIKVSAPALVVGDLANGATMTYTIEHSDAADFGTVETISPSLVQTGAGGVGAAAATLTVRPGTAVKKYIRAKAVNSGAGDASDKSLTLEVLF